MTLINKKSSIRVLLVDDDEDDYIISKNILLNIQNLNFTLDWTVSYEDALIRMSKNEYDIFLVDYRLGKKNGLELLKEAISNYCIKPIIILTGQEDYDIDVRAMKLGAMDYLVKRDLNESLMERSIRYAIEKKTSEVLINNLNEELEKKVFERTQELNNVNNVLSKEIQEKEAIASALKMNQDRLGITQKAVKVGIFDWNVKSNVLVWSPELEQLYGIPQDTFKGGVSELLNRLHPEDLPIVQNKIHDALNSGELNLDYRIILPDRSVKWVSAKAQTFYEKDGTPQRMIGVNIDITSQKKVQEKLNYFEYYDPLTDLPNRSLFKKRLKQSISYAKENNQKIAVIFIDIDRFKIINESLGYLIGDKLLKYTAQRLAGTLSSDNVICRQGGDEFMIMIPSIKNDLEVSLIVEKIIQNITQPFYVDNNEINITISMGVSIFPTDSINSEDLLTNADAAMYLAKNEMGNSYKFYTKDMHESVIHRLRLDNDLRKALRNNEFQLYYQPKINLHSDKIVGMECLIRWFKDGQEYISPSKFIPTAEENGMIIEIGEWVLKTACIQTKKWQDSGITNLCISVNVSIKQMKIEFIETVKKALKESNLKPKYLELEITESDIMKNDRLATYILDECKKLGITISIDDFGTGYSSLSRISNLPIDILKIDKSFIDYIDNGTNTIVEAVIAIAKSLKLSVIAEGVENKTQYDFLKSVKCDAVQGYYLSPPLSVVNFAELIKNRNDKKVFNTNKAI